MEDDFGTESHVKLWQTRNGEFCDLSIHRINIRIQWTYYSKSTFFSNLALKHDVQNLGRNIFIGPKEVGVG